MRLIDADEAYKVLEDYFHVRMEIQHKALKEAFERVPTINAVLVRHGHWILHDYDFAPAESTQECSVCHEEQPIYMVDNNYCPNCGAKMDDETEERLVMPKADGSTIKIDKMDKVEDNEIHRC